MGSEVKILTGDCFELLRHWKNMPSNSVDCVVLHPPYYRTDFSFAEDVRLLKDKERKLGSETLPEKYVERMKKIFKEIKRVLKSNGVMWLIIGDTYKIVKAIEWKSDEERWHAKRKKNIDDRGYNRPKNGPDNERMAVAAERYTADDLGVDVADEEIYLHGDDCDIIYCGKKIDVKCTPLEHGKLMADPKCKTKPDIYVFVVAGKAIGEYDIKGWAIGNELRVPERLKPVYTKDGRKIGDSFQMEQMELRSMDELRNMGGKTKPNELFGIPERIKKGLQEDGWCIKKDIIWKKSNLDVSSDIGKYPIVDDSVICFSKSNECYGEENIKGLDDVLNIPNNLQNGFNFPILPSELVKSIMLASCPVSGMVLDPMSGSGIVGEVAMENGRNAILIDKNPECERMAKKKIEDIKDKAKQ